MLAQLIAGKAPEDYVFISRKGGLLRLTNFRPTIFDPAERKAGLDGLTPHGLRHTAASLAITGGADVKVVQQMLGHAGATMTLDLYVHLYSDRLDGVADRMDALRTASRPSPNSRRTELQLSSLSGGLETLLGAETGASGG